ncbi:class A beta-lactamase-related serine hydrolase [Streptomyces sp. NBC_01239]|uniref:serine hydrolase n=1 Tax=Streptomyces sp. NBC_01239 TaxID=2903792 RepID=UPI00225AB20A|nr:serine hydrolase [Streptomyces sp. NBC_01239]MCX4809809.1 class A beta-lactamase-related serine hydrolase [Streptomyces sp. NBC_01239]
MESSRAARRNHRARPSRRRRLPYLALATVAVVGATAAGTVYVKAHAHSGPVSSAAAPSASASGSGEATVEPVTQPTVDHDALLAKAMKSVTPAGDQKVSVAVLDVTSGESAAYGDAAFDTASIVKVDILAALLLQAQDAGRTLTATEKSYATTMIQNSDNDSATALWNLIGTADGLDAANKTFGLTGTTGGAGPLWGLTRTTAADQLTLLQQVFGDDSKLSAASQSYIQGLMKEIEADQQWGVSAAADGSKWALKNGWLARSTTGLWDVNSIGRVTGTDGDEYLVAVLSNGSTTQAKGITLIEAAAKAGVAAFAESTDSSTSASATATD